jgi:protein-disulfide isomerase
VWILLASSAEDAPVPNKTCRVARSRAGDVLLPLLAALAALSLAGCAQGPASEPVADVIDAADEVQMFAGIPQQGGALGDPLSPVTLVELSDLRCSHCRDFAEQTLPVLVTQYVREGKVRIVFEDFPILGPDSVKAARMAAAVGLQGRQFDFVEAFFYEGRGSVTDDLLRRVADEVPGVDAEAALSQMDGTLVNDALAEAKGLSQRFSITGTPSFLLAKTGADLQLLSGARAPKPETFTDPIDKLLAQE